MTTPRHNRDSFFKYYTLESAKLTLGNGSRKWSTPFLFNDPFDNQFDLDFPDPTPELVDQQTAQFIARLRSTEPFAPDHFVSNEPYVVMEYLRQVHQDNPDFQYTEDDIAYLAGGTLQGMQNVKKTAPEASAERLGALWPTRRSSAYRRRTTTPSCGRITRRTTLAR
jgi:hypothetical protein